ncbi:MAG: AP2 domain-containing protein [Puniceicoccaceae bacterium]
MGDKRKEKGISRIDSASTHGWFVRGYRNGKTYSRLFSDLKCGGREDSLQQAREFREKLAAQLQSIPQKPRSRRIVKQDSRNRTGVIGVCRTTKKSPNGNLNECYSVSWRPEPGVQKCTSFSIRKYGEKKAFQLAVAHRKKMLREIHGTGALRKSTDGKASS